MDALPFVDDITRSVDAPAAAVWGALLTTLAPRRAWQLPRWLVRAWGLRESGRRGAWSGDVQVGDAVPGFAVSSSTTEERLTLRGSHRFARYELAFEIEPRGRGVLLHAKTSADFPGLRGAIYRALVIGSGGHAFVVRRMLASVARRARGSR